MPTSSNAAALLAGPSQAQAQHSPGLETEVPVKPCVAITALLGGMLGVIGSSPATPAPPGRSRRRARGLRTPLCRVPRPGRPRRRAEGDIALASPRQFDFCTDLRKVRSRFAQNHRQRPPSHRHDRVERTVVSRRQLAVLAYIRSLIKFTGSATPLRRQTHNRCMMVLSGRPLSDGKIRMVQYRPSSLCWSTTWHEADC